jgi:pimeloyl-ACP methyl ester carboxylesterase
MSRLSQAFDRTGRIRRPPYRWLLREAYAGLTYRAQLPDSSDLPPGQGRVVLLIPAFLTTDAVTRWLRLFLQQCGYRPFGWDLGLNFGPTPRLMAALRRRLAELRAVANDQVSLVGVSLGGMMARELAFDQPDHVRDVITIGSPINLPTASTIEPLIRLVACFYEPAIDIDRQASPLSVRSTAIFSRGDGVVAWETCRRTDPNCSTVEVTGPHLALCQNPDVLRAVAAKLATP